jgi:uncharacterized protein (TIGR04141 family)
MAIERTTVSAYLLKPGARDSLERRFQSRSPLGHGLTGWFHLMEAELREPAWLRALKPHLTVPTLLNSRGGSPSAVVLVERGQSTFILTFGHAWMYLDPLWLEPDFGRRVALNAVPPTKVLELNSEQVFARWHVSKERSPQATSVRDFGVTLDRDLVAALEGVPSEPLFGGVVRGSTSLRMKIIFASLPAVLDRAGTLFLSDAYKKRWPEIDNLTPVSLESEILALNALLDKDFKSGAVEASGVLFAPSFRRGDVEFADNFVLGRLSSSPPFSPYLQYSFWKRYLLKHKKTPSVQTAKETKVHMMDVNGEAFETRTVYDCLGYELSKDNIPYILSSGIWYKAETNFVSGVARQLKLLADGGVTLPAWDGIVHEDAYNKNCCSASGMILFDRKIVHYGGDRSKFEFCDFMHTKKRTLFFAKIASRSSGCSHLVEQVKRTIELFFGPDSGFRQKLKKFVDHKHPKLGSTWLDARPRPGDWKLCLVLMGRAKEELPLFARCSVARLGKYCDEHGHELLVKSV